MLERLEEKQKPSQVVYNPARLGNYLRNFRKSKMNWSFPGWYKAKKGIAALETQIYLSTMPGIDLENGYTPGSNDTELGKGDSAILLDENTEKGEILSEEAKQRQECNKKAEKIMIDGGLIVTAICLVIFASSLFFYMVKIQNARDGYSEVIVTPYPDLVGLNTTEGASVITIPCYYPPSTDYLNFPVNCSYNSSKDQKILLLFNNNQI